MDQKDAPVINAMKRLAGQYPRYGYRQIDIFLAREGFEMGEERCHRLWEKAGFAPGFEINTTGDEASVLVVQPRTPY